MLESMFIRPQLSQMKACSVIFTSYVSFSTSLLNSVMWVSRPHRPQVVLAIPALYERFGRAKHARSCRGADGPDRRVWHQCLSRLRAEKHRTRGVAARRGSNLLIAVRDFGVLAIIASLLLQALTSPGDLNRDETRGRREL